MSLIQKGAINFINVAKAMINKHINCPVSQLADGAIEKPDSYRALAQKNSFRLGSSNLKIVFRLKPFLVGLCLEIMNFKGIRLTLSTKDVVTHAKRSLQFRFKQG
jgi:hypothetical protein